MKPKKRRSPFLIPGIVLLGVVATGALAMKLTGARSLSTIAHTPQVRKVLQTVGAEPEPIYTKVKAKDATAAKIVADARKQIGTYYDARYVSLSYPNGDVKPMKNGTPRGACTDVIVRALRAVGYDLQKLIHDDMKRSIRSYPRAGGKTDKNIDHRRVPNQMAFFKRHGKSLTKTANGSTYSQWQPGDIVCWNMGGPLHTGIISDTVDANGKPLVIHNMMMCAEEDVLHAWEIIGHYRFPKRRN